MFFVFRRLFAAILLVFIGSNTFAKDNPIEVTYFDQGKKVVVKGQASPGRYVFNTDSSKKVTLATLDWPPYIGEKLCNRGWVFQLAVAAWTKQGYQVQIDFMPWARGVKEVESGRIDILFPEYQIEETAPSDNFKGQYRLELLQLSDEFPGGEVALVKRKNYRIDFSGDLNQLSDESIGVVRSYQNTPEFDALMDQGFFNITEAIDDLHLVRLLEAKRVNLIVGDPKVFETSIKLSSLKDKYKREILETMKPLKPALQYNNLHFTASKQTESWEQKLQDINQSLAEFKASGELNRIIRVGSDCELSHK